LQYLLAGWTTLFGFSEFTLRFPIVIFGTALVPVAYLIARDLAGPRVALIAAIFITFDFWQVELSRSARFYAPFFLTYALFCLAVYRGIMLGRRPWVIAILPLGLLSISLHNVGLFGAAVVLIPAVCFAQYRVRWFPYFASVTLVVFTALIQKFEFYLRNLAHGNFVNNVAVPGGDSNDVGTVASGFLARMGDFLLIPDLVLFKSVFSIDAGKVIWMLIVVGASYLVIRISRVGCPFSRASVVLAVAFAMLHQFTLAFIILLFLAGIQRIGIRGFLEKPVLVLASVLAVVAGVWLLTAYMQGHGSLGEIASNLFEYPRLRIVAAYPVNRPLVTVVAAIGFLIAFDKCARPEPDRKYLFLILVAVISYLPVGMFETRFSYFRYVLHTDVFYFTLAGIGLLETVTWIRKQTYRLPSAVNRTTGSNGLTFVFSLLLTLVLVNPVRASLAVSRDYLADSPLERWMDLGNYPDFKGVSEYISANARADDQILVFEPREYYNYLGKVDAWIRSSNFGIQVVDRGGSLYDSYITIPLIHTRQELEEFIQKHPGRTWIPFNNRLLEPGASASVEAPISEFLQEHADRQVMTAQDGTTFVYLFDQ
jgi:hypothetical protein